MADDMKATLTEDDLRAVLGEAVHTAFRKGSDHKSAAVVWEAIKAMPTDEWAAVVDWIAWSLFFGREPDPKIAALLRFQSVMTPEMWDSLAYALRTGAAGDKVKSALDTLRQELQQP